MYRQLARFAVEANAGFLINCGIVRICPAGALIDNASVNEAISSVP